MLWLKRAGQGTRHRLNQKGATERRYEQRGRRSYENFDIGVRLCGMLWYIPGTLPLICSMLFRKLSLKDYVTTKSSKI